MFSTRSSQLYDLIYERARGRSYRAEAERILEIVDLRTEGRARSLLDLACGTGGHLPAFSERLEVEALDIEPAMLEVAARRVPGLRLHQGDMASFDLGRRFDVIVSLFSCLGYVRSVERMQSTMRCLARHLEPGGLVILEPWFTPDNFLPNSVHAAFVDLPEIKVARFNHSTIEDGLSVVTFHYVVADSEGIEHFVERHEMALFSRQDTEEAFRSAGLKVEFDPEGLGGRGLYFARRPALAEGTP